MEFIGNLIKRIDLREGDNQNGHWKIATYLLETVEMYPKRMAVEVFDGNSARCAQWDAMVGKNVKVTFDIDAREWNGKWYNSIKAFGIRENVSPTAHADGNAAGGGPQPAGKAAGTGAPKLGEDMTGNVEGGGHSANAVGTVAPDPSGRTNGTGDGGNTAANKTSTVAGGVVPANGTGKLGDEGGGDDDLPF